MKQGKRYAAVKKKIDATKVYSIDEALALIKETPSTKFDETIELHVKLGIDPKQSDQQVRGTVVLPHGSGKKVRIAAFVTDDKKKEATDAGADIVGNADLIEQIKKDGKCDFDVAIATPDMMKDLAVIARVLGQKGLMPNPKTGTITPKIAQTVKELKQGKLAFKNDGFGNIHVILGKVSFDPAHIKENFETFVNVLKQNKPEKLKAVFVKGMTLATTMGPAIKVSAN